MSFVSADVMVVVFVVGIRSGSSSVFSASERIKFIIEVVSLAAKSSLLSSIIIIFFPVVIFLEESLVILSEATSFD